MKQKNKSNFPPKKSNEKYSVGRQIKGSMNQTVLLIDENNVNCGYVPLRAAMDRANAVGLDLVQVSEGARGKDPTCKILDYSKFKYELSKKEKLAKKKQRESSAKIKEIKFRPSTDANDLKVKAKQAEAFIEEGNKVKITIVFKGRELAYKEIANNTLQEFIDLVPNMQLISVPSLTGRNLSAMGGKKADKKDIADDNNEQ